MNSCRTKGWAFVVFSYALLPTLPSYFPTDPSVSQASQCLTGKPFNDSRIGYFDNKNPTYCDPRCLRSPIICCVPQKPDAIHVKYRLYTSRSPNAVFVKWDDEAGYKQLASGRVVFVIPGYYETVDNAMWVNQTKDGWLTFDPSASVITVDWREANQGFYFQVVASLRTVGAIVGYSVWKWKVWSRTELVGFSFGAQIVGEAARFVQSKGYLVRNCAGLDPRGSPFDGCKDEIRLKRSDCKRVENIHTSRLTNNKVTYPLGSIQHSGHCDYYVTRVRPNSLALGCGYTQTPCFNSDIKFLANAIQSLVSTLSDNPLNQYVIEETLCSHYAATIVYIERLKRKGSAQTCPLCSNCGRSLLSECGPDAHQDPREARTLPPDSGCDPMFIKKYIYYNP